MNRFTASLFALAAVSLGSATAANAAFIQGIGPGTAIPGIADRNATFDNASDLSIYSEDSLSITAPSGNYNGFDPTSGNGGGFMGAFFYPSGGVNAFTILTTTDATPIFAAEVAVGSGYESSVTHYYYEAYRDASIISSGAFDISAGSIVSFFDPTGFDGIRMGAYGTLEEAQSATSISYQALAIDNVRVNVGAGIAVVPEANTLALVLPVIGMVCTVVLRRSSK